MISAGPFSGNIDSYASKAWRLNDQKAAFAVPFVASTQSTSSLIEPTVIPLAFTEGSLKTSAGILEGPDLTASLLSESLEYFQKALYNFNSQYLLAKHGYQTWAHVTNYYSSYFSVFSLLALQGRLISRVKLNGVDSIPCLLHPIDLRNHRYILTTKGGRDPSHKLPWRQYYTIYNNYTCLRQEFEVVQLQQHVAEPIDESESRNKVNYNIYAGFQEIVDLTQLNFFKNQYLDALILPALGDSVDNYLAALSALATDPNLRYFARSAIRLFLIRSIYDQIAMTNVDFRAELAARVPIWQATMFDNYQPKENYYEDFVGIFLS